MLKKALFYLGLGSDEEYEQYDEQLAGGGYPGGVEEVYANSPTGLDARRGPGSATVRPIMPAGGADAVVRPMAPVDDWPRDRGPRGRRQSSDAGESAVRIVDDPPTRPANATPHTASPTVFEDAPQFGERLKGGQPVILNLQNAERGTRRRLLDFASGACYALGGNMDRVADQVFLITPPEATVRAMFESRATVEGVPD